ncbi:Protein argonaute-2, partial [Tulasnella sp. 417]
MYVTRGLKQQYVPTTQVLIFRDGVSEGQFMDIIEHEIVQVKEGVAAWLAELKKNANISIQMPRLTFVVVGKKHHFRMFEPRDNQPHYSRVDNCQSGTIIDRHVTNPYWDDYYLLSYVVGPSFGSYICTANEDWDALLGMRLYLVHLVLLIIRFSGMKLGSARTNYSNYLSTCVTSTLVQLGPSPSQRQFTMRTRSVPDGGTITSLRQTIRRRQTNWRVSKIKWHGIEHAGGLSIPELQ